MEIGVGGGNNAPINLGDEVIRWTIAGLVGFWSIVCPFFWGVDLFGYVGPLMLGSLLSITTLLWRSVEADQSSWKL